MRFFKTIKFRISIWFMITIAVILTAYGIFAYFMLSYNLNQNMDNYLRNRTSELESLLNIENGVISFNERLSELVLFYNADGKQIQVFGPNVTFSGIDEMVKQALIGDRVFFTTSTSDGQLVRLYAIPFSSNSERYAIVIGRSINEIKEVLATYLFILEVSTLSIIILVSILSFFLANQVLRPVDRMVRTARDISASDLRKRIPVTTGDELGRLASTLNQMIEGLEGSFNRQRQFAGDISHELRTPLSVIEAEATLALSEDRGVDEYKRSLETINEEATHMTKIIEKLLFLVRSDASKEPLNLHEVNLKEFIIELAADIAVLTEDKGIKFTLGQMEEITISVDRVKLRQVFNNLIDNAIRYTPPSGEIAISAILKNKKAVISVSDTGQGIPAEHIPHIFERFYRVDSSRSHAGGGTGLGLAIVKSIVEAHGGKIEVESEVGKGAIFRIFLPVKHN
jgi:heavy metal sensor kinase